MHYTEVKGLLSAQNGMNLYRGCTHGCIYCDSRSHCYHVDPPFEDVEVKRNAPELLEAALRGKRRKCMIGTGAMSDPYIPLEQELGLTRACLEIIERHGFGLTILTKSDGILRDIDLLERIHNKAKCVVQMTLTTYDEALCRTLEPNVCTTRRRFEALKAFQARGIPTVVWLCPLLPFINDTEDNLRGILGYCFEAGVHGILNFGIGLTLREGNREYFYAQLDAHFPGLRRRYAQKYGLQYAVTSDRHAALMEIFRAECRLRGVLCEPDEVFRYLHAFPEAGEQLRMF